MSWLLVTLLVMAIIRVTRLLIADQLTERLRDRIWDATTVVGPRGNTVTNRADPLPDDRWKFGVRYVWTCQWCMSIWVGPVVSVPSIWIVTDLGWGQIVVWSGLVTLAASYLAGWAMHFEEEHH